MGHKCGMSDWGQSSSFILCQSNCFKQFAAVRNSKMLTNIIPLVQYGLHRIQLIMASTQNSWVLTSMLAWA